MKKLIVANWKMNPQSLKEAEIIFKGISSVYKDSKNSEIVICPPFPFLFLAKKLKLKKLALGAQNVAEELSGAYTSQTSVKMLESFGVKYSIVGHSECRKTGETDKMINKKIGLLLKSKIIPILCVGESTRDTHGFYLTFVKNQIHECLAQVPKAQMKNIVIAYEPIWAIGEKAEREATAPEFTEMKIFIRKIISDMYDGKVAHAVPVLYGGSVNPLNSREFIVDGNADGLLVGRDSLNPKKFAAIIASYK